MGWRDAGRTLGKPLGELLARVPLHWFAVRPVSTADAACSEPAQLRLQEQNNGYQPVAGFRDSCFGTEVVAFSKTQRLYRTLGERIRTERKRAKLSQEKLAEVADLNRNYIGEIERAEKKITVETLWKLARAMNVRIRDLVSDLDRL